MQGTVCLIDWKQLRKALGLTQEEMADLLHIRARQIYNLERGLCSPHKSTVIILRSWLSTPALRARLVESGYDHPFPEDLEDGSDPAAADPPYRPDRPPDR
ncbi:MAG: XRE family transcriptional regulator [Chloroflexota bacterium]|nr:MAG: XRE family transcriptional regulator [Chloroflexota bacterium]